MNSYSRKWNTPYYSLIVTAGDTETIEEIKEAVMKVIDTLTQENFDGAF